MAENLMGFKKIDCLPERRSVYDDVIEKVIETGDIYALDTHDAKRATSLCKTIRNRIRVCGYDAKVIVRGNVVCVVAKPSSLKRKHDAND